MSYYPKGHHDGDDVDDFDEFDPTPYGGGYDIALTYGRPLPPSENTCYPTTSTSSFDYDRPQYSSYSQPSAYADEALDNEYKSYARPKPHHAPSYGGGGEAEFGGTGFVSGSQCGRKPEYESPGSEYGSSGYGRKTGSDEPTQGYDRRPESDVPSSEYGSGYGRKSEYEQPGSEYGSGYGRKPSYGEEEDYRKPSYERPSYGRSEEEDYRKPSYERRGDDDEDYGRKKYGDNDSDDDDDEKKHHHGHHHHHHRKHYDD
ncbi:hypothetical protein ACSBR2_010361 [Camellia fascicularis]